MTREDDIFDLGPIRSLNSPTYTPTLHYKAPSSWNTSRSRNLAHTVMLTFAKLIDDKALLTAIFVNQAFFSSRLRPGYVSRPKKIYSKIERINLSNFLYLISK